MDLNVEFDPNPKLKAIFDSIEKMHPDFNKSPSTSAKSSKRRKGSTTNIASV